PLLCSAVPAGEAVIFFNWEGVMRSFVETVLRRGVLAAALAAGFGLAPAMATEQDTLVIGKSGDPDNLDPAVTVTNDAWTGTYPSYERLVRFKVENGKGSTDVEGDLAQSWQASPDGKVFTFTLADGHKFADGSPVDAAAVKFSFERLLK